MLCRVLTRYHRLVLRALPTGLLFLTVGCGSRGTPAVVLVDESLDEVFSIRDVGFMGYSRAAQALRESGYTVAASDVPLPQLLPRLEAASRYLVIVGLRFGRTIGPANIDAIHDFLTRGGRVLLLAEHDDIYGSATASNEWTRELGIEVLPAHAAALRDTTRSPGPLTYVSAAQLGVDSARFYFAAPLRPVTQADTVAVAMGGEPVALSVTVGTGRLVVVGESEFLWNGTQTFGVRAGENTQLWLGMVHWLLRPRQASVSSAPTTSTSLASGRAGRSRRRIAVVADPHRLEADEAPDGFAKFLGVLRQRGYEVVAARDSNRVGDVDGIVLLAPSASRPSQLPLSGRIVAAVEARSTMPISYLHPSSMLAPSDAPRARDDPLAPTLAHAGVEVLAAVLRDGEGRYANGGTDSLGCRWGRPAALRSSEHLSQTLISTHNDVGADMQLLWPATSGGEVYQPRGVANPPYSGWPLVVRSSRMLVFASTAPFENQSYGTRCFQWASRVVLGLMADSITSAPARPSPLRGDQQ